MKSFPKGFLLLLIIGLTSCGGHLDLAKWSARQCYRDLEHSLAEPDRPELQALEGLLKQAIKLSSNNPGAALDLYLEVAERTFEMSTGSCDEALIYRHAVGHAVVLLHVQGSDASAKPSRYSVSYAKGQNYLDPSQFDSIIFTDSSDARNIRGDRAEGRGCSSRLPY